MTTLTVFGESAPPGTYSVFSDGSPSIRLATRFYRYGSKLTSAATIVGGRVWLPSAPPAGVTGLRIMLWAGASSITTTPLQSVVVPISGTGWQVGMFAGSTPIPAVGERFKIGYEFVGGSTSDDVYVFSSNTRAVGVLIPLDNGLAYSEDAASFASGGGETDAAQRAVGYGIDAIVDDGMSVIPNVPPTVNGGANRTIYVGQSTTLAATAADSDGTVASVAWTQTAGPSVTLGGSGASRTFTPSVPGVYTWTVVATDDDGEQSIPDPVTVTVLAVPVEPEPEPEPEPPVRSAGPTPFPMIERAIKLLLESHFEIDDDTHVGGDLSYDASDDFYIWIGIVPGGRSTEIDGMWVVDIDVFDSHYSQAMDRCLAIEAFLLKSGGHRTPTMRLDNVSQNEGPAERPWDDESAFRIGATYVFTARRSG